MDHQVVVVTVDLVVVVEPINLTSQDMLVEVETHHQHLRHRVMMVAMEPLLTLPGVLAVVEVLEVLVVMDLGPKVVQEEQQLKHQQTGDLPLHMELLVLEVLQEIIMQEVVEVR